MRNTIRRATLVATVSLMCIVGFILPAHAAGYCTAHIGGSVYARYYWGGPQTCHGYKNVTYFQNNSASSRTVGYRGVYYFLVGGQRSGIISDPNQAVLQGTVQGYGSWWIS